jgi:hypothetical protein
MFPCDECWSERVPARVCVCVCWMVPAGRAATCAGAGELAPRGGGTDGQPGPWRGTPPTGWAAWARELTDLPTTSWRRTQC